MKDKEFGVFNNSSQMQEETTSSDDYYKQSVLEDFSNQNPFQEIEKAEVPTPSEFEDHITPLKSVYEVEKQELPFQILDIDPIIPPK